MVYLYLGIVNIPLLIVGGLANLFTFYCLVTFKKKSSPKTSFGNLEILLLSLNISDTFMCLGNLPVKIATYILTEELTVKPTHLRYLDTIGFWSSSLIVILIAFNNYLKISSPHNYHSRMSRKRIYKILALILVVSVVLPIMLFINIRVISILTIVLFVVTVSLLSYMYRLITKAMKNATNRIGNKSKASEAKNRIMERKVTKNVLTIVVAYALCSLTILVTLTIFAAAPSNATKKFVKFGVYVMTFNSIINPCIYVLNNKSYRKLRRRTSKKVDVIDGRHHSISMANDNHSSKDKSDIQSSNKSQWRTESRCCLIECI